MVEPKRPLLERGASREQRKESKTQNSPPAKCLPVRTPTHLSEPGPPHLPKFPNRCVFVHTLAEWQSCDPAQMFQPIGQPSGDQD